mmetsp:Transcript_46349/g.77840  ORF Transcript_46349/g.77840 Transcript_46349/m.77840 type:complete len:204 (+) Transcript_46349:212-823(+)
MILLLVRYTNIKSCKIVIALLPKNQPRRCCHFGVPAQAAAPQGKAMGWPVDTGYFRLALSSPAARPRTVSRATAAKYVQMTSIPTDVKPRAVLMDVNCARAPRVMPPNRNPTSCAVRNRARAWPLVWSSVLSVTYAMGAVPRSEPPMAKGTEASTVNSAAVEAYGRANKDNAMITSPPTIGGFRPNRSDRIALGCDMATLITA